MPELPEAETIVHGLRRSLPGRRLEAVEILHEDLVSGAADDFRTILPNLTVSGISRRGKNPVISLEAGRDRGPRHLVINLGMSGRLLHRSVGDPSEPPSHPGVRFELDDGSFLVYADVRRFGRLRLLTPEGYRSWSAALGPEPLSRGFTGKRLGRALSGSASPIRSWLLDQRRIAGVGNIYANEALFLAGVHPRRPANRVREERVGPLHRALRSVLREAIRAQGTTLRDYRTATGREGSYGTRLRVYGREGAPCARCRSLIERAVFGGRSAFFCSRCQPELEK